MSLMLPLMYRSKLEPGLIELRSPDVDDRITFTRASDRTYFDAAGVLQTATTDVWPLEFDPATGECLGRSVWAAATNLALHSADLTNAAWVKSGGTAAKDQVGLDGVSNSASSFTADGANQTVLQTVAGSSASRTYHVWLKRLVGTGNIDITQDGGSTWTPVTLTASYQRFKLTQTVTNPQFGFRVATSGDSIAVDGNQLETGSIATPYIPTTSATVTRALDSAVVSTLSSIGFNATEGAIVVRGIMPLDTTTNYLSQFSDGTSSNQILQYLPSDGNYRHLVTSAGATQANINVTSPAGGEQFAIAAVYKANDFAVSINGGTVGTDAAGTVPAGLTELNIGISHSGGAGYNGYIRSILYIPRRITNAELQKASTL